MKSKPLLFGIAGLILGGLIVSVAATMMNQKDSSHESSKESMDNKMANEGKEKVAESKYAALTGDAFDEAYLADMLAHHEGAVNMSEQAQSTTAHEEIRTLASNIVQTQSTEIAQMRQWQSEWGYGATMSGGHMSHGGGGMDASGDMVEMQNKLNGLSGEAYDKEFLVQMTLHHEQAIEMSQFAEKNAKHQEIKELGRNIITAQKAEIAQMKQWQVKWGYKQ